MNFLSGFGSNLMVAVNRLSSKALNVFLLERAAFIKRFYLLSDGRNLKANFGKWERSKNMPGII